MPVHPDVAAKIAEIISKMVERNADTTDPFRGLVVIGVTTTGAVEHWWCAMPGDPMYTVAARCQETVREVFVDAGDPVRTFVNQSDPKVQ